MRCCGFPELKPGLFYRLNTALKRRSSTWLYVFTLPMELADGLDDSVVKFGADLFDGLVGAVGPGAVRQQSD